MNNLIFELICQFIIILHDFLPVKLPDGVASAFCHSFVDED
jgi:hypothetical protein